MELNPQEVALVEDLRRLPRLAVEQVVALTHRLAAAAERGRVDRSDSWSEKDLREYSRASADRLAALLVAVPPIVKVMPIVKVILMRLSPPPAIRFT
jgi:hypothetical protein